MVNRLLTRFTHRIHELPILILMPHSRCNCRCVMCDIWKANNEKKELSVEQIRQHLESFKKLNVRWVVLSGGEALMHANLWNLCSELNKLGIKVTLLSTGLLLKKHAEEVVTHLHEVIVSLDGSRDVHNLIRNVPMAFEKMQEGIEAIRERKADFRVTARCVLQHANFRDFPNIIKAAKQLRLNQISFLAADVSTSAFNRETPWTSDQVNRISLTGEESLEFERIIEESIAENTDEYASHFIAESPRKMRKLVQYYKALNGEAPFPEVKCNAPWVSAVLESDGSVQPCFFLPTYGNINYQSFGEILNSSTAIAFRKQIRVPSNSVCQKCVCSLNLPVTASL